jgi:hypothetical protein
MPFKVNFRDEDSSGNPSGSFNKHVSAHGNDPLKTISGSLDLGPYPVGGFDVSKITGMFDNAEGIFVGSAGGYTFEFVKTTEKVMGYSAVGTEITADTDLSSITIPFIAVGR